MTTETTTPTADASATKAAPTELDVVKSQLAATQERLDQLYTRLNEAAKEEQELVEENEALKRQVSSLNAAVTHTRTMWQADRQSLLENARYWKTNYSHIIALKALDLPTGIDADPTDFAGILGKLKKNNPQVAHLVDPVLKDIGVVTGKKAA